MPGSRDFSLFLGVDLGGGKGKKTALATLRVDGEVIHVKHPEQVLLAEQKSTVIVDVGHRIHIMDSSHISKLSLLRRQNGSATKG